ncbi:MAG: RluA family pseudouridine synthase [Spirochaetes bacterium]|nr:RluA family pseudouridine synthase [Spirochaetota bacterium]
METILKTRIAPSWAHMRLIQFLSLRFRYHSESEWKLLIHEGKVLVNNSSVSPDFILSVGDVVSYRVSLREPPVDKHIRIVYEDEYFLVASKPPNLPSHADGNFITHTFIYLLNEMMKSHSRKNPYKLVNRLDRETSGLIVATNNPEAHKDIARQFELGKVYKEYIAIARGEILNDTFTINGPIIPDAKSKISIRRTVGEKSKGVRDAITSFEVIERLSGYTVVRCIPQSGKTSQIRVHISHAGHPLAGDKLYGHSDDEFLEYVTMVRKGNYLPLPWMDAMRHMLHAYKLSFVHPKDRTLKEFVDPIPEDMVQFIEKHKKK